MIHGLLFTTLFRVLLEAAPVEISGYIGDTVTLPLGAGSLLNLWKVQWSVFANTTLIATYEKEKTKVDWFYQYAGRLSLNITTGDLTIRELQMYDALVYHVEFFDKLDLRTNNVRLVVKQQFKKPIIKILSTSKEDSLWWLVLHCSSPDEGVDFTWQVKTPRKVIFKSIIHNNYSVALVALNTKQEITCTSGRSTENTSSVIIPKLVEETTQPPSSCTENTLINGRSRHVISFLLGFFLASTLMVILKFMACKIRSRAQSEPKTNSFEMNCSQQTQQQDIKTEGCMAGSH